MKHGPSPTITADMAAEIKALLARGFYNHEIAARYGVNQGRISEIRTGKAHAEIKPKDQGAFDF